MVMVRESTGLLKGYLQDLGLGDFWTAMALRIVLAFVFHRGRMSCSYAAGTIASEPVDRSQVTRKGAFMVLVDGTLVGQAGMGSKMKPRIYYAYKETPDVHSVGKVQLVYSATKPNLTKATPDDVKILMTNAMHLSLTQIIDLYTIRWQMELFFKELKSRLGFDQYRFKSFSEVEGWVTLAVTTVLFLETTRAKQMARRDLTKEQRQWWSMQRLHGLGEAFIQMTEANELKYISERIKTPAGVAKLKRMLLNTSPTEYRHAA